MSLILEVYGLTALNARTRRLVATFGRAPWGWLGGVPVYPLGVSSVADSVIRAPPEGADPAEYIHG